MLLFRSEEHVDRWCRGHRIERGAVLSLEQAWELAVEWYRDRLRPDWRRKTVEEAQVAFARIGLTSPFWRLSGPE
ncbi:MAG: hypothetical protein JSV86_21195 [Gemmatimonadota bacterium]|nr:MAG: hypothetical protein JSV86_21195 [Gemmatimonadota bacterium]